MKTPITNRRGITGLLCAMLLAAGPAHAAICTSGAEVELEAYCSYFKFYRADPGIPDDRIAARLSTQNGDKVRSVALIIGNSVYPNISGANLDAAAIDVSNLTDFFIDNQKFDEVIVLTNGEATKETIDYFLSDYLRKVGLQNDGKSRLVVAYSGHGVKAQPDSDARLLLSSATSMQDSFHSIPMTDIRTRLGALSNNYFHVLALINACYSGALFSVAPSGGNLDDPRERAAHAYAASSDIQPSFSLGGPNDGSIFFDNLLAGIKTGDADPNVDRHFENGVLTQHGGVVRLGSLNSYMVNAIDLINASRNVAAGEREVRYPWIGSIVPPSDGVKPGGFFFLSPIVVLGPQPPVTVPYLASFVVGHPNLQVFGASEEYQIHGIDVSHYEGDIDWGIVKKKTDFRFAYIRLADSKGRDDRFAGHWQEAQKVGIDRGAVGVFDFCRSAGEQFADIAMGMGDSWGELPFAIDVGQTVYPAQSACRDHLGLRNWQAAILDLAAKVQERSGKTPLIYGTRYQLNELLDERFKRYMVWLAVYRKGIKPQNEDLGLKGGNPWALWQYDSTLSVPGIGDNVDGNVFFGDERAYGAFKNARFNLTLQMATMGLDL